MQFVKNKCRVALQLDRNSLVSHRKLFYGFSRRKKGAYFKIELS